MLVNHLNPETILENIPGIIWIKDLNLSYIFHNNKVRKLIGFKSKNELLEKNDYELPWAKYAEYYREGDKQVVESRKPISFFHPICLTNGNEMLIVTHKSPLYDSNNHQCLGVMGNISIVASPHTVKKMRNLIHSDKIFSNIDPDCVQYVVSNSIEFYGLTKREIACLFYLMRGKTAKEIGDYLNISKRTVEKHIEFIKCKMSCNTKSEILTKAIEHGFIYLIPSEYFLDSIN